jgi:hypothetical protein
LKVIPFLGISFWIVVFGHVQSWAG